MAHAIAVRCPNCGASLSVEPSAESATCSYCGTRSVIVRKGAPPQPPNVSVIVVRSGAPVAAVVIGVLVAAGAVVAAVLLLRPGAPAAPAPVAAPASQPAVLAPAPPPRAAPAPAPLEVVSVDGPPLPFDGGVVARASFTEGGKRWEGYGAWTLPGAVLMWQHESPRGVAAAIAHGRLLLLSETGQLEALELATARPQWSTALGDKGVAFCASREADAVEVQTLDRRQLVVDVKTGKQAPSAAKGCTTLASDGDERRRLDPRDRRDRRAPTGVTAIRCGTVRVMGTENYVVDDQCRARTKLDPDGFGFAGNAMWQLGDGWLIAGVRDPGTHTPVLGVVRGKKLAWKVDVPEGNPLEARAGGPEPLLLDGDQVIAGYTREREGYLTAFALADGARRWHAAIPDGVSAAVATPHGLLLRARGRLLLVSPKDGALLGSIGR